MAFRLKSKSDYQEAYKASIENPENFWEEIASHYTWQKPWTKVFESDFEKPDVKWFLNAKLNITENCLDRHLKERGDKIALIWEPNNPKDAVKKYTYKQLHAEVCKFANVLKARGIKKGDRVCLYMPMIPELSFAVLACARIGAIHSVVFAGFSASSLADRINDASANTVITSDAMNRGAKKMDVKGIIDEALTKCTTVEHVIVVNHLNEKTNMQSGRDVWYHEAVAKVNENCPAESMDSEDMLFILYTSGSTGKPKGVVHTCGGYMVYAGYSFTNVFQCDENDIYWCTADIGWITGHTYIIYGPLLAGATTMMFEGIPTWPDAGRFWDVVDKHQVNIFYTAPTAIRSLMAKGLEFVEPYNLSSLKVLGTVGEPINVEAWDWYNEHIGKKNCPIADTWWQTETGGIMITALAGISDLKPSFAGQPMPGVQLALLDADGKEIEGDDVEGYLCIKHAWPSMIRTTYGDHERCKNVYFSNYKGYYFTGDGARREK
ncbi:MAG: acetate--CoA ligase, partial [Bacteroidia bacterium]|nr:acetate--CoA ligase [Bacteroidia bacterium]